MTGDRISIFSREHNIHSTARSILNDKAIDPEALWEQYKILLNNYKKLIRQAETLTRTSDNQQRRLNTILERLGRYVSFQLFKKITHGKEKVEIRTQRKKLTVFFSDLKGFSYISSHMEGEALSEFLNSYLEQMTQIVIKWGGTLDKYMGDGIMVFFGDSEISSHNEDAFQCVGMAVDIREKMKDLRKKWYEQGYQEPLHVRMGIATGYCTVGNFGSSERMDYTIIGVPVNLASRLETAADIDEIFISHETWGYVKDRIVCESAETLQLKGFYHPIMAHKVIRLKTDNPNPVMRIDDEQRGLDLRIDFSKISKEEIIAIIENYGK